jgi:integrase
MIRSMEVGGTATAITLSDAVERFLSDAKARNLSDSSLKKYRVLLQGRRSNERASMTLEEYAEKHGYRLLKQINIDVLRGFRQGWKDAPLAARKKLERLRAFFRFALEGGWVSSNPALAIKPPLLHNSSTMPLDDEELEKVYGKLEQFIAERKATARGQATGSDHLDRLKALLLLLEHSGLRIIDAIQLNRHQILDGRLVLRAQKNQGDINLPIPPHVLLELERLRTNERQLFFWSGQGKPETATGNYRRTLRDLGEYCKVADLHPHRLRDTFAVRLLQGGAPLDRVARALGNRSVRVVERHYAPWIKSRQDALDADVEATWSVGSKIRPRLVRVK